MARTDASPCDGLYQRLRKASDIGCDISFHPPLKAMELRQRREGAKDTKPIAKQFHSSFSFAPSRLWFERLTSRSLDQQFEDAQVILLVRQAFRMPLHAEP